MIKNWNQFNESYNENYNDSDLDKIMEFVAENIPSSEIPKLISELSPLQESHLNENIFRSLKDILIKWFDTKIMNYIVNKKANFYTELIGKLDIFNLSDLSDIRDNFRNFNLRSIYLAGGMDKAKDVGAGWRAKLEYEFEVMNPGIKSDMDNIIIPHNGDNIIIKPAYTIDGINLDRFIKEGGNKFVVKYYDTPAILNPVRKEVDRTKNKKFADEMGKFKRGEYEDTNDPRQFDEISKIFSNSIELDDELIVNMCDAIFYGVNEFSSGGTFGELQQASFLNKPIFAWYIDGWKISGHSPWNIPHISKIIRTDEDMKLFVKTMINFSK